MNVKPQGVKMVAAGLAVIASLAVGGGAWAEDWKAPEDAKKVKNTVKGIGNGKKAVETNCSPCHGAGGKGDGPAAAALPTKPADWTSDRVQKQTDGEIFWKITTGRGAMPPWKSLPDKEVWEIVNYIRTLKK